MKIAKAGNIHNFCHPNSLFTLQARAAVCCWTLQLAPQPAHQPRPAARPHRTPTNAHAPPCPLPPQEYLNDYGDEEAKRVGEELIEKERVIGLSESAQVRRGRGSGAGAACCCSRAGCWADAQPALLLSSAPHHQACTAHAAAQDLTKRKLQKVNEGEHDVVRRGWPRAGGWSSGAAWHVSLYQCFPTFLPCCSTSKCAWAGTLPVSSS